MWPGMILCVVALPSLCMSSTLNLTQACKGAYPFSSCHIFVFVNFWKLSCVLLMSMEYIVLGVYFPDICNDCTFVQLNKTKLPCPQWKMFSRFLLIEMIHDWDAVFKLYEWCLHRRLEDLKVEIVTELWRTPVCQRKST